jgi:hypothetical protein
VCLFVGEAQGGTEEAVGPLLGEGPGLTEHDRHRRVPDLRGRDRARRDVLEPEDVVFRSTTPTMWPPSSTAWSPTGSARSVVTAC